MSTDLIFYTNPQSRGRVARWMLEEIGAPYETRIIAYGPEMKSPDYLAINPLGKVPAIQHKGAIVTETAAICTYLADAFPEAGLIPPAGTPARAAYYRWMFFASGPLDSASMFKALGVEVPAEKSGMLGFGSFELTVSAIEGVLRDNPYFTGEAFTAVDVFAGATLGWLTQFKIVPLTPVLESYLTRINQRPAAVRAAEIDNALLAKQS